MTSGVKSEFYKWLSRDLDHVISVSETCRRDFVQALRYPERKTTTITIGVDTLEMEHPQNQLRKELGLPHEAKIIINVGSLVAEKNHRALLKIFGSLQHSIENSRLILVGHGPLHRPLLEQCKRLGIENKVLFLGYRTDVGDLLRISNLMIMPSLLEGLPGAILEAMLNKLPVVASNVGGIAELIDNNKTGFILEPEDIDGFVRVSEDLLHDLPLCTRITTKAYQMIQERFDNSNIAEKFISTYQRV